MTAVPQKSLAIAPALAVRWRTLAWVAVLVGAMLRLALYLRNQSFWGDEAYVILNLRDGGPMHLLGGLHAVVAGQRVPPQSAPPMYLWTLYALSRIIGQAEWAMRLPALVMGILALPLMAIVSRRLLSPGAAAAATAMLALSPTVIQHTVLVKQYSGDLAVAVALLSILLPRDREQDAGAARYLWMSVAAAALLWWSEAAIFVWSGLTLAAVARRKRTDSWFELAGGVVLVLTSFAALYFISIRAQQDPELYDFWRKYLPDWHRPWMVPVWIGAVIFGLVDYPFRYLGPIILILFVIGLRQAPARRTILLLGPILTTLAAALAGRYPFGGCRLCLFLLPSLLLLAGEGIDAIAQWRPLWSAIAAAPMIGAGIVIGAIQLVRPPITSHLRPIEKYLMALRRADEPIYLAGANTWPVFYVYWPNPPGTVIITADGADVAPPTSGRAWLICEYAQGEYGKRHGRKEAIDRLSRGGTLIQKNVGPGGAAFEYDYGAATKIGE